VALGDADARSVDVAEVFAGDSGEEAFAVDVAEAFAVDADEEAVRVCRAVGPGEALVLPVCVLVDAGGE
jgi:hypothetical protein